MRHFLLMLTAVSLVAGCGGQRPLPNLANEPAFDAKAAAYIHKQGDATIQGEAFVLGANGKPVYAAGELVRLVPATAHAQARFRSLYKGKTYLPAGEIPKVRPDPEYAKYTRTTVADGRGKFLFDNVAPGKYFVTAQKIIRPPGALFASGGAMYTQVAITGRERFPVKIVVVGR